MQEFKVPELGENVSEGEVAKILVKVGDTIARDQPVLELETDKATIEVPSSVAGVVKEIKVKQGDKVTVGAVILTVDENGAGPAEIPRQAQPVESAKSADQEPQSQQEPGKPDQEPGQPEQEPGKPDQEPGQPEQEPGQPEQEPGQPEQEPGQPEQEPGQSEQEPGQPEQEPGQPEQEPGQPEQEPGQSEQEPGQPEQEPGQPEQEPGQPEQKPGQPKQEPGKPEQKPGQSEQRRPDQKIVSMPRSPSPASARQGPAEAPRASALAAPKVAPEAPRAGGLATPKVAPEARAEAGPAAPASPSVRRLAREIGVDVNEVHGSGPDGRISQEDVKEHARRILSSVGTTQARGSSQPATAVPLPDFEKWGAVERRPMSNIRRKTAEHLSHAWTTIPHVTQFDKADITAMEELRAKFRKQVEKAGGNLTVTAVLVKVIAAAVKEFPQFNASLDADNNAIIYKKYVSVGVAVDTAYGLLVPVIRNADQKNITQIAAEMQQLSEKARGKKLSLDEMSGGGISISNLGGIGGTYFTPIVNWPEVAILGVSRGIVEPAWRVDKFEPRQLLPLSLSYDHRVIDGADAMRFLRWVVEAIEQPFLLSLLG